MAWCNRGKIHRSRLIIELDELAASRSARIRRPARTVATASHQHNSPCSTTEPCPQGGISPAPSRYTESLAAWTLRSSSPLLARPHPADPVPPVWRVREALRPRVAVTTNFLAPRQVNPRPSLTSVTHYWTIAKQSLAAKASSHVSVLSDACGPEICACFVYHC